MFDWFRAIGEEFSGIDHIAAEEARKKKREQERQNRFIFSQRTKIWIIVLAVIYIVLSVSSTVALIGTSDVPVWLILKNIMQSIIALVVAIALAFGKQKGEIIGAVGAVVFVISLLFTVVIL